MGVLNGTREWGVNGTIRNWQYKKGRIFSRAHPERAVRCVSNIEMYLRLKPVFARGLYLFLYLASTIVLVHCSREITNYMPVTEATNPSRWFVQMIMTTSSAHGSVCAIPVWLWCNACAHDHHTYTHTHTYGHTFRMTCVLFVETGRGEPLDKMR